MVFGTPQNWRLNMKNPIGGNRTGKQNALIGDSDGNNFSLKKQGKFSRHCIHKQPMGVIGWARKRRTCQPSVRICAGANGVVIGNSRVAITSRFGCIDCGGSIGMTPDHEPMPHEFDGVTFDEKQDGIRLVGQMRRVYDLMRDGHWRTLHEIAEATCCLETAVSARLRDFRKPRFGCHSVELRRVHGRRGLFLYRLVLRKREE